MNRTSRASVFLVVSLVAACSIASKPPVEPGTSRFPLVSAPLAHVENAYALAGSVALPARKGEEVHGLHNLFQLSKNLWSGSEPDGEEAFEELAKLGVKTVVSVDGKRPEVELAAKHGLRYVHVPIEYRGISDEELLQLAKTFRECDAPFYAHCFHGKHRGPTAAAVGRLVLDGAPRQRAIAEMRQWCGTASDYEGLFRDIAMKSIPTPDETRAYVFDFPTERRFDGLRVAMIDIARRHDALKKLEQRGFAADPQHPDVDALGEAIKLADTFQATATMADSADRGDDFRGWRTQSEQQSAALRAALVLLKAGDATAIEPAKRAFAAINKACADCHAAYRNH
ncbi:MAG: hypothetical protein EXS13_11025 [Planctomycetes bacterium]|nr:hypothetical protein [Planctomycetota bacterium]